jgi:DNA transformation protein and related proteins
LDSATDPALDESRSAWAGDDSRSQALVSLCLYLVAGGRGPIRCNLHAVRGPDKFTAYLLDLLAPIGPVSARPMFGGVGLFHSGMMFGLIARDEFFLKVGDTNRAAYEAAGEAPFSYETKHGTHTISSYWRCPPDLLDDVETFQAWARQAVEAAVVAARGKPKTGRKRGGTA